MSTRAVTPEAPAVSDHNSEFLPTDANYRLTGELPAESGLDPRAQREERKAKELAAAREKKAAVTEEVPATSTEETTSSTAAASEAATTEEQRGKGPAALKTAATSESRWAKMSRENRELREQLEKAKTVQPSKETQRETSAAPPAATEDKTKGHTEPQIDDVDPKTGKAKYASIKEYLADHAKWNREEAVREFREESAKTQREQQAAHTEQIIEKTVNDRVKEARKTYPDYDEVAASALAAKDELGREVLFYTKGSHIDGFFLDADRGQDVLYQIFKDFDTHSAIFARDAQGKYLMNPVRQLRELAKIENALPEKGKASTSTTSVRPVTQAPRPAHQVSGKGTVAKDAVERAVEEQDSETYIRETNNRILARLAKKG